MNNPKLYHVKIYEDWHEKVDRDYILIIAESKREAEQKAIHNSPFLIANAKEIKQVDGYKIKLERVD